MFLDFMETEHGKLISNLAREGCTYNKAYEYWRDNLFERVMRLFVWNTGNENDKQNYIAPKEIEQRLLLVGHCGITRLNGELTAMYGTMWGVTKYLDEFKHYTVRCPIFSGQRTIGKDIIVIDNNSLRNPVYPLVHRYAMLLAHCEVTLIDALVNARDSGGIPVATTEKQKRSIEEYQSKVFNGQYGAVTDVGNLGINYLGSDRHTNQDLMTIYEIREKLIKSFYSDIGVRSAFEKRNNTVMAEVEADTSLLLLNLSDMIKKREEACEKVNDLFGVKWSVKIADEIDYGKENERVQFSNQSEVHIAEENKEVSNV